MRLVEPVYKFIPKEEKILGFKGYNKKSVIMDGEMRDMYNLASDEYPCLYQRKPRGIFSEQYEKPTAMIVKNKKLAVISNGKFYFGGIQYPTLSLSDATQMVAINTRICFFPEKKFFNVKTNATGDLAAKAEALDVTLTITTSTITFPSSLSLDTKFSVGDAVQVTIEGNSDYNVSAVIKEVTSTAITFPDETFISVLAEGETSNSVETTKITVERKCPDLDFVMESGNRLWGVSSTDNTIYACKLGDPTNWAYFQNTTLDSYYAEQGTDGEWTGCAAYSSHLLFFKEDYIHKLYGNKPSNFQVATAQCHALEKGSNKSIAIINETVLYKSRLGIMAYSGGIPILISENFGTDKYADAIAGTDGIKYFVSVMRNGDSELLVYDMERFLWHKEDNTRAKDFCYHNGKLLYINNANNTIYQIDSDTPMETENDIQWYAELGPFDEFLEEKKVYSRLKMRLKLVESAELDIYIKIDSGEWERLEHLNGERDRAHDVPIVPRRCDKFSIKLSGKGYCKVESLVRQYRQSTSGRL